MNRRLFLASTAASLAHAAARLPANQNVKWAVSSALWGHFPPVPFTDILDVMRDTGFIGMRVTSFPQILTHYGITASQMEKEVSKRNLQVVTISFNGPMQDAAQHKKVLDDARRAMEFLKTFGAKHLVVFSPSRRGMGDNPEQAFRNMCDSMNQVGELANEMGFRAGLHNHLDQMVESRAEIDKCMKMTDPKLFHFSPDTAHLYLAKCDVVQTMRDYKNRLMCADYKDAKWTEPTGEFKDSNGKKLDQKGAKFLASIYDLGDGEVNFPGCHRLLKEIGFKGWLIVDLDAAREGPRKSYERCGAYIVNKLEPIYK